MTEPLRAAIPQQFQIDQARHIQNKMQQTSSPNEGAEMTPAQRLCRIGHNPKQGAPARAVSPQSGYLPDRLVAVLANRSSSRPRTSAARPRRAARDCPPPHTSSFEIPFIQFQILFHSLLKVLFIFPSQYLFAIDFQTIFRIMWNLPHRFAL